MSMLIESCEQCGAPADEETYPLCRRCADMEWEHIWDEYEANEGGEE